MTLPIPAAKAEQPIGPNPWILPEHALTVLYGCPEIQRLSHYFLPRLLLNQKRVLYLYGANQISPLLIAQFARERGLEPSVMNGFIRIARAFTCFQLTELIRRVPKVLSTFSAEVLMVTALPDLFFDEDVQECPARASFEHALEGLRVRSAIQQIALEHRRRYGYRRITAELRRRGMQVNHKRVLPRLSLSLSIVYLAVFFSL